MGQGRGPVRYVIVDWFFAERFLADVFRCARVIVFFPRSQQNRLIMFMRDHLMMSIPEAKELVHRFSKLDRYLVIQMHSPVCMFNSKYLLLL